MTAHAHDHGPVEGDVLDQLVDEILPLVRWGHAEQLVAWFRFPGLPTGEALTPHQLARDVVVALDQLVGLTGRPAADTSPDADRHGDPAAATAADVDEAAQDVARACAHPRYAGDAWKAVRDQPGTMPHVLSMLANRDVVNSPHLVHALWVLRQHHATLTEETPPREA